MPENDKMPEIIDEMPTEIAADASETAQIIPDEIPETLTNASVEATAVEASEATAVEASEATAVEAFETLAEETTPTLEAGTVETMPEEALLAVDTPPAAKVPAGSSHKKITILLICLAVVLLALGGLLMAQLLKNPIKRMADAGKNSSKALEASAFGTLTRHLDKSGSVTLKADLSEMQNLLPLPIKLDAEAYMTVFSQEGSAALQLEGRFMDKTILDALLLYQEGRELAISSESLLGKTNYGVNLKTLSKNLEGSVFDPASGSDLALPQALFDCLKTAVFEEKESQTLSKGFREHGEAVLDQVVDYLSKKAKCTTGRQTITLGGESIGTGTVTIRMDEEVFCGMLEVILDYGIENKDFNELLLKACNKLSLLTGVTAEALLEQTQTGMKEARENLPQLKTRLSGLDLSCTGFMHGNKLLRLDINASQDAQTHFLSLALGPDPQAFREFSAEFRLPDGSQLRAVYEVSARTDELYAGKLTLRQDAQDTHYVNVSWDKKEGGLTLLLEDLAEGRALSLSGEMQKENRLTTLKLTKLALSDGTSTQEIPLKGFSLILNEAAEFPTLPNYTDITTMSQEQINSVLEDLQKTFNTLLTTLLPFGS